MGLTAKQIRDSAFQTVKQTVKNVMLSKIVKKGFMKNGRPRAIFKAKTTPNPNSRSANPKPARVHQVVIWAAEDDKKLHQGNVMVSCDCEFFMYTCEVALQKKGASIIHFSNGEKPELTNPRMVPTPCKHVLAAINRLLREKDNI